MTPDRRAVLAGAAALLATQARADDARLKLDGALRQGGFVLGRTWPGAMVMVDGEALTHASDGGLFIVGFDRDAGPRALIEARRGGRSAARALDIAPFAFDQTRIDGLPPATVEPSDPALLARIAEEARLKAEAFASRAEDDAFAAGFDWPLAQFRVSSRWGAQRVLNGTPARPHYGLDMAAPEGTAILAPGDGRVVLAQANLHFEGGLTLIDHGQGLVSAYLHQSRLDVGQGDRVRRGQVIGHIGRTGRATGPHLCWRLRWRDRNLDPSLLVGVSAPA